ncbi:hypothetical protein D3C79_819280 [compost metagenome]
MGSHRDRWSFYRLSRHISLRHFRKYRKNIGLNILFNSGKRYLLGMPAIFPFICRRQAPALCLLAPGCATASDPKPNLAWVVAISPTKIQAWRHIDKNEFSCAHSPPNPMPAGPSITPPNPGIPPSSHRPSHRFAPCAGCSHSH